MTVQKTRSFQLHAGGDLYPHVSQYLMETLAQRMDSIRTLAIANQILEQAEVEGKEYIETILNAVGRPDITVSFGDPKKDQQITLPQSNPKPNVLKSYEVQTASFYSFFDREYLKESFDK